MIPACRVLLYMIREQLLVVVGGVTDTLVFTMWNNIGEQAGKNDEPQHNDQGVGEFRYFQSGF